MGVVCISSGAAGRLRHIPGSFRAVFWPRMASFPLGTPSMFTAVVLTVLLSFLLNYDRRYSLDWYTCMFQMAVFLMQFLANPYMLKWGIVEIWRGLTEARVMNRATRKGFV